jgi:hypothetical protein
VGYTLLSMAGDWRVCGPVMLEVLVCHRSLLTSALFLVGFFEWGIVYFTDWEKQVKIAYAR